ncbi:MAG: sensor histidine kinase [Acidobacteriota bacterium]
MRRVHLGALTIKAALVLGFGTTALLWLFTGYRLATHLADVEEESTAITTSYLRAQERLSSVRAQVLVSAVYVRDALLDRSGTQHADYEERLEAVYAQLDRDLALYVPVEGVAVGGDIGRLRVEITDFRDAMREVLAASSDLGPIEIRDLLNRDVVPRRESIIRISDELRALNRNAYLEHQAAITRLHRDAEQNTWWRLGLALAASLGVALLAILYTGRLESRLRRQGQRDTERAALLRTLSERLINTQEDERRRIARELHDEVGQLLTAMKVELTVAQRALTGHDKHEGLLADAQEIAESALNSVRDMSQLLHPPVLDDLGLSAAIEWHLRQFTRRHQTKADFLQRGAVGRLPARLEVAAYRIVQEALTNVTKHSRASRCSIRLSLSGSQLHLAIEDDGVGFDAALLTPPNAMRGLGLLGMRERVSQLAGAIAINSAPGHGTQVSVTLPVPVPATPEPISADVGTVEGAEVSRA